MKGITFFVLASVLFIFCLPVSVMARRDAGPPEWTFDDPLELGDWRDFHDIDPASVSVIAKVKDSKGIERNVLRITSTGENPYIYPGGSAPSWEPFDAYERPTIYLGVRVQQSDTWRIDYITSTDGEYDEAKSQKFRIDARPDFTDIEIKMNWQYMIRGFRIHPGTTKNKITELDYISLRGPVRVTQTPRRLATTWGRIKDLF